MQTHSKERASLVWLAVRALRRRGAPTGLQFIAAIDRRLIERTEKQATTAFSRTPIQDGWPSEEMVDAYDDAFALNGAWASLAG